MLTESPTVSVSIVDAATTIEVDATLFDVVLRPRREGGERTLILHVPSRQFDHLLELARYLGQPATVTLMFRQFPLGGTEGTSANGSPRRRGRRNMSADTSED